MLKRTRVYLAGTGLGPTLARATLGGTSLRVAGMVVTFLVGVQLARGMGAEGYGTYALVMSIIALLTVPTEFGLPQLLTREVAAAHATQDWARLRDVLAWANRTVALAAATVTLSVTFALLVWPHRAAHGVIDTLFWGCALVPLVALANLRGAALCGLQRIVLGQTPEILIRPAAFSLLLVTAPLVWPSLSPEIAMALHVVAAALAFLVGAVWLRAALPKSDHIQSRLGEGRRWLASAFPMALTEGMRVLQGHLAILLLGLFDSSATVGLFRVALSTAVMVSMPISLFNMVAAPLIARLHAQRDNSRLQRMTSLIALAMFVSVALLTVPFIFAGHWLVGTVFGKDFQPALPALLVLCFGHGACALFGVTATLLNMTGHERRVTHAFAVSLLINLVAALALIPALDEIGAALANLLGIVSWSVLMWWEARQRVGLDTSLFSLRLRIFGRH